MMHQRFLQLCLSVSEYLNANKALKRQYAAFISNFTRVARFILELFAPALKLLYVTFLQPKIKGVTSTSLLNLWDMLF